MKTKNKLIQVLWNVDFRNRHDGLTEVAAKKGIKIQNLSPGEMVCFVNVRRDRLMVMAGTGETDSRGVLAYYRSPHGKIDEMAIQFIPRAFSGGRVNYDSALKEAINKRLGRKEGENAGT